MKELPLICVVVFVIGLGFLLGPVLAADNDATQEASTSSATTINIVGKVADTAITTITFPQGAPSATVSAPYNNVDTSGDPQFLDGAASEPVVRLKNTSGVDYDVTLEITAWTNSAVASEDYELVATTTVNVTVVDNVLSSDGGANSTSTGIQLVAGDYKAFYLEIVLAAVAGVSSSSTLTVLGET